MAYVLEIKEPLVSAHVTDQARLTSGISAVVGWLLSYLGEQFWMFHHMSFHQCVYIFYLLGNVLYLLVLRIKTTCCHVAVIFVSNASQTLIMCPHTQSYWVYHQPHLYWLSLMNPVFQLQATIGRCSCNLGWVETNHLDMILMGFSVREMAQLKNHHQLSLSKGSCLFFPVLMTI